MPSITYSLLDEQMTQDDKVFFKKLGKRLAELRKESGFTQAQLAEAGKVVRGLAGGVVGHGEDAGQARPGIRAATPDRADRHDAPFQTEVYFGDAGGADQTATGFMKALAQGADTPRAS